MSLTLSINTFQTFKYILPTLDEKIVGTNNKNNGRTLTIHFIDHRIVIDSDMSNLYFVNGSTGAIGHFRPLRVLSDFKSEYHDFRRTMRQNNPTGRSVHSQDPKEITEW